MWPKQKLWKKQLSLILKGNAQQLKKKKKKSRLESTRNFPHKSSAFLLFTDNSKLIDLKMDFTVTIWKLLLKMFESDSVQECEQVWEAGLIPRKETISKRVPEYFWEEEVAGVAARMCFIGLKWKGSKEKLEFCTHYEAIKAGHTLRVWNPLLIKYCFYGNIGHKVRAGSSGSGLRASRQWTLLLAWIMMLLSQWLVFLVDTKGYSMDDWMEEKIKVALTNETGKKKNMPQPDCHSTHSKENLSSGSGLLPRGYVACTGESTSLIHQDKMA